MNKIKNFIIRHPHISSFWFPIVLFFFLLLSYQSTDIIFAYFCVSFFWIVFCINIFKGKRGTIIINFIAYLFISSFVVFTLTITPDLFFFGDPWSKKKSSTTNHKEITNFMMVKFTQCSTGESELTYTSNDTGGTTTVPCSVNAQGHLDALINHLKYENFFNPYVKKETAVNASKSPTPPKGRTHISCLENTCTIYTNDGYEILSATVKK
tara:strand:+ start:73 stop:702 length:630 start_codon:yes stop_codon:yes gene_type:complete